jgi:hypothetical protein
MATSTQTSGISFVSLLQIVFIVLKFLNKISWSWFWVLSPLWISFSFAFIGIGSYVLLLLKKK